MPLHLDAVGAFGHVPLSFRGCAPSRGSRGGGLVALSVSAHKLGGPVGVGALVVAREAKLEPLVHGGGQQRGLRAGTQDAAGAAAFAVAAELAVAELDAEAGRVGAPARPARGRASRRDPRGADLGGERPSACPGTCTSSFPARRATRCCCCSTWRASPCRRARRARPASPEPSHVVLAMGLGEQAARSALRLTLGRTTTDDDVDAVLGVLPDAYERARRAGMSSRVVR